MCAYTPQDYDRFTTNDFMGKISLPVCAFFEAGPGSTDYWVPLTTGKKHRSTAVTGEVCVRVVLAAYGSA